MKRKIIGTGEKWGDALISVLEEFVEEEADVIDEVFKETANETKDMVQNSSPGSGEYASGWEVIAHHHTDAFGDSITYTVGNPKHYQLTHLLEKGHAVKNQYGEPTRPNAKHRVSARRHIRPAEAWGNTTLIERLKSKL